MPAIPFTALQLNTADATDNWHKLMIEMWESNRDNRRQEHVTVVQVPQQPTSTTPRSLRHIRRENRNSLSLIGAFLMFFGMASAIMAPYALGQETGVVYYKRGPYFVVNLIMHGLWVGVFMTASGVLGLWALRNQSHSMYLANFVLCIITTFLTIVGLIIAFVGAALSWNRAIILHILITISIFIGLCLSIAQARLSYQGIRKPKLPRQQAGTYLNTNIPIGSVGQVVSNNRQTFTPNIPDLDTVLGITTRHDEDDDPPPPYPGLP